MRGEGEERLQYRIVLIVHAVEAKSHHTIPVRECPLSGDDAVIV